MSDSKAASPQPAAGQGDLHRYREGAAGVAGPGPGTGMMMGWALPPSFAAMPPPPGYPGFAPMPPAAAAAASLGQSLGTTVRLGLDLLNAVLAGSATALAGAGAMAQSYAGGSPGQHGHHGCGCEHGCGQDCCAVLSCACCQPRVQGCCG